MGAHGYLQKSHKGTIALAHRVIAERVLGRPLPPKAEIHHWDENKHNNAHDNLVICPDRAYHRLLHLRQAALEACGDADKRRCTICKKWDDQENLKKYPDCAWWHAECNRLTRKNWKKRGT